MQEQYLKKNPLPSNGDFMETYRIRRQVFDYAEEVIKIELYNKLHYNGYKM